MTDITLALDDDEDIVMVGADGETGSPDKASRGRKSRSKVNAVPPPAVPMPPEEDGLPYQRRKASGNKEANSTPLKQTKPEDDIVMVDAGGPSETPRRSDSTRKSAGLGGMFGGLLSSKSRPDTNKRRNTAMTEDETRELRREERRIKRRSVADPADVTMSGGAAEEDQEARRAARRARRAEKESEEKAAEDARKAKDDERRERHRKADEDAEARRRDEKEAKKSARREAKAQEDSERRNAEAKELERAERRRARRLERAEKEPATDGEGLTEDPARVKRSDRRRSHADPSAAEDEARRRRREERRSLRDIETPKSSRHRSAPLVDGYFDPRNGSKARDTEPETAGETPARKESRRKKPGWPHSGTSSWVQETSDAPPPPELTPAVAVDDDIAGESERRQMRKTRRRKDDGTPDDIEERRKRRESRRGEKKSSEGSQGDRSRRDSGFVDTSRAPSAQGGLWGRLTKKIAGN